MPEFTSCVSFAELNFNLIWFLVGKVLSQYTFTSGSDYNPENYGN